MANAEAMYNFNKYKNKLDNVSSQKRSSVRKEEEYKSSKSRAETDLKDSKKEKLNLEKRLEGVRKILGMMEGSGGLLTKNVPDKIQNSNKSSNESGDNFKGCIKCSDLTTVDVAQKFHSDKVHENVHSANALSAFKAEEQRLENAIDEINRQINQLNAKIETLKKQIKRCNSEQAMLDKEISKAESEMLFWKKKL